MRGEIQLNGTWRYQVDPRGVGEALGWPESACEHSRWLPVSVPVTAYDAYGPPHHLRGYEGTVWFARTFSVPSAWEGSSLLLAFTGSNYATTVWLNGQQLGHHEGAFVGFRLPVPPDVVLFDRPNLLVVVTDNRPLGSRVPGPFYGWWNHGGLYREVTLEALPAFRIDDLTVRTVLQADGRVDVNVEVAVLNESDVAADAAVTLALSYAESTVAYASASPFRLGPGGRTCVNVCCSVDEPRLWSPEHPHLYELVARFVSADVVVDETKTPVGLREIRVDGDRIRLNGHDLLIKGVNRHEDYATTGRTHDPEWLLHDLRFLKDLGVNFIRTSHYPNHPAFYDLADRMGFLVMDEIPLYWWGVEWRVGYTDPAAIVAAEAQLRAMIARDKNHSAVVFWSVSNETGGGKPDVDDANRRLIALAKELDPSRLAVHVSDHWWEHDGALEAADVICINEYVGLHHKFKVDTVDGLAAVKQPLAESLEDLFSRYPDKPVVVSEFGCEGMYGVRGEHFPSEDYQVAFVRAHIEVLTRYPRIRGLIYWDYADYPVRGTTTTSCYGLVTRHRQRKLMAKALRAMYADWGESRP